MIRLVLERYGARYDSVCETVRDAVVEAATHGHDVSIPVEIWNLDALVWKNSEPLDSAIDRLGFRPYFDDLMNPNISETDFRLKWWTPEDLKHLPKNEMPSNEQLLEMWEKGAIAWKDVPNATEWVEKLRGNKE